MIVLLLAAALAGPTTSVPDRPAHARFATASDCGDFLARMHKKPAHAIFVGCAYQPDRQGKPLTATYRVSGPLAAATEAYLIRAAGLHRLKLMCCHWEAPTAWFKDAEGRDYSLDMGSGDTVYVGRDDWGKITTFEITVETMTEEI